jgi:GMP synthase-like glutamine amidotransferase
MIVFVDYEHAEGHQSEWGPTLLAARTRITYRLEDISGHHCMLVRYDRITRDLINKLDAKAIFISGNGTDPARYDQTSLDPLREIVTSGHLPLFGFCGGFQFLAQALGSELVSINADVPAEYSHLLKPFSGGQLGEMGYHPVQVIEDHSLVAGIGPDPVFRHAHHLEVPEPPAGFQVLASSPVTQVQMAVDEERRVVGTQFHPEYYTDEFPAGERMIANFLSWAGVTSEGG